MTLQIAMVGQDGLVLASDKKVSSAANWRQIPGITRKTITRTFKGSKILLSPAKSLVCLFSSSDAAAVLAQAMTTNSPSAFATDQEVSDYLIQQSQPTKNMANELVIAAIPKAVAGVHKLWRVVFMMDSSPLVQFIEDKLYGGDESIASVFYGERYYDPTKTVDELKLLAAHIVFEGHCLSPMSIDGLEILIVKDGEYPHLLEEAELESLKRRSEGIHAALLQQFHLD